MSIEWSDEIGFGPRCPNHNVVLIKTGDPGIGICPISDARFRYDEDQAEKTMKNKINALGQIEKTADWGIKFISGDDN